MTRNRFLLLSSILLVIISISLRYLSIPYSNDDMNVHNLVWYKTIVTQGGWNTLGTAFTNYSPPYSYLLAFISLFKDFIEPLTAIKLIPIVFDVLGALLVYKITSLKYPIGNIPLLASSIYFTAPTVILNSSYWGQVDSIYTFFLIACLYFLVNQRYNFAWVFLGISFSVKAQAIFILPLFLILIFRRQINWWGIFWLPITYTIVALPTILLGRPILEVLSVYLTQSGTYGTLSRNAPNLYMYFPQSWYLVILPVGMVFALFISIAWAAFSAKHTLPPLDYKKIFLYALISVSLVPFVLPKMHDRYFYTADVLSIIIAFLDPKLWFIPLMFQAVSLPGYAAFLFEGSNTWVYIAALLNSLTIALILKRQSTNIYVQHQVKARIVRLLSILLILSISIVLIGTGMRSVFTPTFIRIETFIFTDQESERQVQYQRSMHITEYIMTSKGENYLRQLQDEQGKSMLDKEARQTLNKLKLAVSAIFDIWHISLLAFFIISVLFFIYGDVYQWMRVMNKGGQISVWLSPMVGLIVASFAWNLNLPYRNPELESDLHIFSVSFWLLATIWIAVSIAFVGMLVAKLLSTNNSVNKNV